MCCNFGPYRNKTYVAMSKTSGTDPQNVCCFLQPSQGVLVKGQFSPYVAYPSTIFVLSIGLSLDDLRRLVRDRLQSFERASLNTHTHRYGIYILIYIDIDHLQVTRPGLPSFPPDSSTSLIKRPFVTNL